MEPIVDQLLFSLTGAVSALTADRATESAADGASGRICDVSCSHRGTFVSRAQLAALVSGSFCAYGGGARIVSERVCKACAKRETAQMWRNCGVGREARSRPRPWRLGPDSAQQPSTLRRDT